MIQTEIIQRSTWLLKAENYAHTTDSAKIIVIVTFWQEGEKDEIHLEKGEEQVFFKDVLRTRFEFLELKIDALESEYFKEDIRLGDFLSSFRVSS